MDSSDNPGFVFRNTSLTIRLRFTPAMACSTRTRIRASLRLARFSAFVSSRPRGFFFRLFRPLPTSLGAVDDDQPGPSGFGRLSAQLVAVALREDAQIVQGRAQNREQVMQPIIRLGGTEAKKLPQDDLERISFQVDQ